ncbi:MAG: Crp/Fnr family transcriptional regulator [Actinomycetota bacterium]
MFRRANPRAGAISRLEPFSGCSPSELETVARHSDDVTLREGQILMHEGTSGRECFFIAEGEALVRIEGEVVATLGPGDIVGEMAVIDREPRSATVVAATPIHAVVLTTQQFNAVADSCPSVARRVMSTLAQRLREVQAA